jgi:replicative DNA helicase
VTAAAPKEFVYDASNEALVLRSAIALARAEDRAPFRALIHSIGDDEFLVGQHSALWRVLRQISDKSLSYTTDTIVQLFAVEPVMLDAEYLSELENAEGAHANLEWHVRTLRWDATRARVMKAGLPELVRDLTDPRVTVERAVTSARSVVRALEGGGGRRFIHRREERAATYDAELMKRREQGNFFPCGFESIDNRMTEGFMPGNTAIVTGLSGSGKSTFAACLAITLAKLGRRPMICAWEMGSTSTLDVLVSMLTGVPLDCVVKGTYDDLQFYRLKRANEWVNKKILFMENAFFGQVAAASDGKRQRRSNDRNLDILEGYIAESGCDEIIMDLWDRLLADQSPEAVTDALYRQQNMHREYSVHGTLLVQLRLKDVEKRGDKRPTRESIKGVGTFVEVPDLIFGVHRDAQFKDVPDNTLEVICLKQRKGRANWAVRFGWSGDTCQITGGEEVPYNPGLEATSEYGELTDPTSIRTKPHRNRMNYRD